MNDVEQNSGVRSARNRLHEHITSAKSEVSGAEFRLKEAQRVLARAQADLEFHADELAAFNVRHPPEPHEIDTRHLIT